MAPHPVTVPEKTRQECWETRRIFLSRQIIIIYFLFHLNLFRFCLNMFALQYLILYCHMVSNFPLAFLLSYHMNAPTWTTNELPGAHMPCLIKLLILLGFHPTKAKGPSMPNLNTKIIRGTLLSRDGGGGGGVRLPWYDSVKTDIIVFILILNIQSKLSILFVNCCNNETNLKFQNHILPHFQFSNKQAHHGT